jgi:hypothetical protein
VWCTVHILRPIADIQAGVKDKRRRTGHEVGPVQAADVVKGAVRGMGQEHGVAISARGAVGLPGTGLTSQADEKWQK